MNITIKEKEITFSTQRQTPGKETGLSPGLPLTFYAAGGDKSLPLCLIISGDGGWTGFDQSLALDLSAHGIPVVGLNSRKYFWEKKNPVTVAEDISAISHHYLSLTGRKSLILLGFSFGADVLPFIYNKLPVSLTANIPLLILLSPSQKADFEIHYLDMLGMGSSADKYDVFQEIRSIHTSRILCFYGSDEASGAFHPGSQKNVSIMELSGGHHYDNSFDKIRLAIINLLTKE